MQQGEALSRNLERGREVAKQKGFVYVRKPHPGGRVVGELLRGKARSGSASFLLREVTSHHVSAGN